MHIASIGNDLGKTTSHLVEKMKSSLAQMKANLLTIRDRSEMDRRRNNVDIWEAMVGHVDRMLKHMESMGPGIGGPPPAPTD